MSQALSDLQVKLDIGQHNLRQYSVLGVDSESAVVVWGLSQLGHATIFRFHTKTGKLLSSASLSTTVAFRHSDASVTFSGDTDEVLLLHLHALYVLSIDGGIVHEYELPFAPSSIIDAGRDSVYLAGDRAGIASPLHLLLRATGQVISAQATAAEGTADSLSSVATRYGVRSESGDVWTFTEDAYQLRRWDSRTLQNTQALAAHPAVLHYLQGQYSEFRIVSIHALDQRHLWVFIRLKLRGIPQGPFASERVRFLAQYDGLVEVIDTERAAVIASRFLPDFDLAGWINGPIGYRLNLDGTISVLHCAVETQPAEAR